MSFRFHFVALPHTKTTKQYSHCAYTQKVLNAAKMMRSLGHTVIHYGAEGSQADCDEHVTVITDAEQRKFFGEYDPRKLPVAKFDVAEPYWMLMNERARVEIKRRLERKDFLCLIAGVCQQPIADAIGEQLAITVEYGIGYYGTFAKFRVFESYTHQATVYGQQSMSPNGNLYDAVIPNYFDPADFSFSHRKDNYLLFLARCIERKGLRVALEVSRAADVPLIIAGAGLVERTADRIVTEDGTRYDGDFCHVSYAGAVGVQRRAELMSHALALLQPTIYCEPFGGNVIEAALCGTPAITTDYGAFAETVRHGVTGYRCHTLAQFVAATKLVRDLWPETIHSVALANYSLDRVRYMYQEYFSMLLGLWSEGWPSLDAAPDMDWLNKS